jgi:hypothetical protein
MRHHCSFNCVRLTFSIAMTGIEQRYVIELLHPKKFGLDQIVAELAMVDGNKPIEKNGRVLDPPSQGGKIRYGRRSEARPPAVSRC